MSSSSNRHALAPTVAQRDADYRYSQQLTNLLDEITELNKTIGETAAEYRRQSIPPCVSLPLTRTRRDLDTSPSNDMSQYEGDVNHVHT
jgi:hypothetical protein